MIQLRINNYELQKRITNYELRTTYHLSLTPDMYTLTSDIAIGSLDLNFITDVEINSTWKEMTDTCHITLPKKIAIQNGKRLEDVIAIGDRAQVQLGWDWKLNKEFCGWVSRPVAPNIPFEIFCEDNIWLFKKGSLNMSWKQIYLDDLLAWLIAQLPSNTGAWGNPITHQTSGQIDLGSFQIHKATPAKVLDFLKEHYGLVSYFLDDVLYVGKVHTGSGNTVVYDFQKNIIKSNLSFRKKDEVHLKITAQSILADNSQVSVTIEDNNAADPEEHTLSFYNIKDKNTLTLLAQHAMDQLHYDGYRGNFNAFGEPFCRPSDIANVTDEYYPERAGDYFIDKVKTTFGQNGYKREIELGSIVSIPA
jgi:hypothetical protein